MTIYERFDLIMKKINVMIEDASIKMHEVENDPHPEQYFYYMGRVHALSEVRLFLTHQIEQHQINEDLELTLDALTRRMV